MTQALDGIRVVDLSQVAAVPMCARHLADFGADVVHIEHPVRGDSWRAYQYGVALTKLCADSEINYNWENYNRNKRSLTIDLAQEAGREIVYKLVEQADVFVTNLRLRERKEFKLEYGTLSEVNPRLVYGSLTGYGKEGPDKDEPGYDATAYWIRSGIPHMLSSSGVPSQGYRPAIGDNVAGMSLFAGIMTALFTRDRTGLGQEVDVSLFQTGVYQMSFDIAGALVTGQDRVDWMLEAPRELVDEAEAAVARVHEFQRENAFSPMSTMYETKDGRTIFFSVVQPDLYWSRFCRVVEREDLEHDPRFETFEAKRENRVELYHILKEIFLGKTLDEWKPRLKGIPYAAFQNLLEVINDPQARANDFFVPMDHPAHGRIEVVANPIKLSRTPASIRMPGPEFGQHTEEVLLELGYTWEDITQFKDEKIIM